MLLLREGGKWKEIFAVAVTATVTEIATKCRKRGENLINSDLGQA